MTEENTSRNHRRREKQCRICLAGSEESQELGKLIRPCLCRGSIRYVHVKCLQTWRKTSASSSAFWSCPQCGFKYAFARTKVLGWSTSPLVLGPTTLLLFLLLVFTASSLVSWYIPDLDDPSVQIRRSLDPDIAEDSFIVWPYSPFTVASDVIVETLHAVTEVMSPGQEDHPLRVEPNGRRRVKENTWSVFGRSRSRNKSPPKRRDPRAAYSPSIDGPTVWERLTRRFILGISLVGIVSFLNLLITASLFAPLQIVRARWMRGGRQGAGGLNAGTIMIIVFVLIGTVRALYAVYNGSLSAAQYLLLRAENAILEVQNDDDGEESDVEEDETINKTVNNDHETLRMPEKPPRPSPPNRNYRQEDDFGDELPDTPGGWQEEWNFEGVRRPAHI